MSRSLKKPADDAAANDPSSAMDLQLVESPSTAERAPAFTLTLHIDEALDIAVYEDAAGRDMRARWDRVKWAHYSTMASGIRDVLWKVLSVPSKEVTLNGSLLCSHVTATPRLLVEVPAKFMERATGDEVQRAVRHFVGRVMGNILEPDAESGTALTDDGPWTDCANEPAVSAAAPSSSRSPPVQAEVEAEIVAKRVLNKVGGATLPVPCRIEMVGADAPFANLHGRCADKPKLPVSQPTEVNMTCFVDGFRRSLHVVFLVECDKDGTAREVAVPVEWLDRVAEYAFRQGDRFVARFMVTRQGNRTKRDLLDLQRAETTEQGAIDQAVGVS